MTFNRNEVFILPEADKTGLLRYQLDIPYANDSVFQKLDLYLPNKGDGPFPVIAFYHGGGWRRGDKSDMQVEAFFKLLKFGYAVASINWRLSFEAKYPKAVFTMDSAFYHYGLTDVIPEKYYLATDRNAAKIPDKRVIQVFEKSDLLTLGVNTETKNGYRISIYSKERMLVELLRHKSKIPFDYYKEVLNSYRDIIYDLDIRAIQDYAETVPKSAMIMETLQLEVL